jgi:hypothetical protein
MLYLSLSRFYCPRNFRLLHLINERTKFRRAFSPRSGHVAAIKHGAEPKKTRDPKKYNDIAESVCTKFGFSRRLLGRVQRNFRTVIGDCRLFYYNRTNWTIK